MVVVDVVLIVVVRCCRDYCRRCSFSFFSWAPLGDYLSPIFSLKNWLWSLVFSRSSWVSRARADDTGAIRLQLWKSSPYAGKKSFCATVDAVCP